MEVIETYQSIPNEEGIYSKTTIYKKGFETIKEVKTYQKTKFTQKVHKNVIERQKNWKPFGKALNENNDSCTFQGKEIFIEYKNNSLTSDSNSSYNKCDLEIFDPFYDKLYEERMKKFSLSVGKNKNKVKSFVSSKTKYKLPFDKFSKNKPKKDNKPDPNKPKLFVFKPKERDPNDNRYKTRLFIENIDPEFMEDDIAEYIRPYGDIKDILILRDKYTGASKCVGIITLYKNSVAQKIIDNCHKKPMGSMIVNIKYASEDKKNKKIKK